MYEVSIDEWYTPGDPLGEDKTRPLFTTAEERLAAMRLMAEDEKLELWYCNRFLEIAVRDRDSGEIWLSTPYDLEQDTRAGTDTRSGIHSFVRVLFFDKNRNERFMTSFTDAVMYDQFGYRSIQNGIEVQMLIGQKPQLLMVPPAAEADSFEALVLDQISNARDRSRLLSYYTRYSIRDGLSKAIEDSLLENYPGFKDNALYILRSIVSDREMRMLDDLIQKTSYTWDDYYRDIELSGVEGEFLSSPVFKITVSFTLDNGNLVVQLPSDTIDFDRDSYTLGRIYLLEYFGAGRSEDDGYMFVPDGCGALINFNTDNSKTVARVVLPVYGDDVTFTDTMPRGNIRNAARFPVFGLREGGRAWFAIIEEGDAMADIIAQSGNFFSRYETVSPALYYARDYLVTTEWDGRGDLGSIRYIDNNFYEGGWTIRYSFLTGEDADYNGMAHIYRTYLLDRNIIQPLTHTDPALYMDVLGLFQKRDTFFGIPYSRKIQFSTFKKTGDMLADMHKEGVGQAVLRFRGWHNGGLDHTVPYRMSVERALGGQRGLKSLMQTAGDMGYSAFFETDFNFVRRLGNFSGYNRFRDGSQTVNGFQAESIPYEMAGNSGNRGRTFYTISPNRFEKYFSVFTKKTVKAGIDLSISAAGTNLLADYHRRRPVNLQQSRAIWHENLTAYTSARGKIIVDGGNAYTLPFAAHIMNMPLADSSHSNTDAGIPFMQLVLHGYIAYSGPAVNKSFDPELALLKHIEFGASPAFTLAHDEIAELKGTPYSVFYSVDYVSWQEIMINMYKRYAQVYNGLANVPMKQHYRPEEGVNITTFTNGTQILVNYNTRTFEVIR